MPTARSHGLRTAKGIVILGLAVHAAHGLTGAGGHAADAAITQWLYDGLMVAAAAACIGRAALVREERSAWSFLGAAMAFYAGGEIVWSVFYAAQESPPFPSVADALYLAYYPFTYVGFVLLAAGRVRDNGLWLDGVAAALAAAAVAAAFVVAPVLESATGSPAAVVTALAYPVGDLVVLCLIAGGFACAGRRPDRRWAFIGAGLAIGAATDALYAVQTASDTYAEGTLLDSGWPASLLLVAWAATLPPTAAAASAREISRRRVMVVPGTIAAAAIALLLIDHFHRLSLLALLLATGALLAVILRATATYLDSMRLLDVSREEALDDGLTGLGNRRRLQRDLQLALDEPGVRRALVILDLDGFKSYNDTFGHPAGDALLSRLGRRLAERVEGRGRGYRLGGDEFCALVELPAGEVAPLVGAVAGALCEQGEGFDVTASHGVVLLDEVRLATDAMRIADQRMYADKDRNRGGAIGLQARDVLLGVLAEREPALHARLRDVTDLAVAVGLGLGLAPGEIDEVARAAELHDIGKMAVPDAVLQKPGPLSADDQRFIGQHTLVGERILGAAPELRPVARLVRSSHERWDGRGYPDGLAADQIPLGSRIIAVCDAYDAMTSDRPYRAAVSMDEALAELRRCGGTQFDPDVVAVFCTVAEGIRDALRAAHVNPDISLVESDAA